jgi:hypothetical protein
MCSFAMKLSPEMTPILDVSELARWMLDSGVAQCSKWRRNPAWPEAADSATARRTVFIVFVSPRA